MKKKLIGIPGYAGKDSNNFGVGNNYLTFFSQFGNVRILMPHEDFVELDLLVLPGGLDVNPVNYGEVPEFGTSNTDVFKQFFLDQRLQRYIDKGTPIFGICLGMQQLAVHFGSKLCQNLLHHAQSPDRWQTAHMVFAPDAYILNDKGRLEVDKDNQFKVNSHHHQAVISTELSDQLEPLLYSRLVGFDFIKYANKYETPDIQIVEAFRHKELPIVGVQYHPEELYDHYTRDLIKELLKIEEYA